jgi:hypothetical protein
MYGSRLLARRQGRESGFMKKANSLWFAVAAAVVMALGGCGGGGGGTAPTTDPNASGSVTVSGVATYEAVPNTSGALDYASIGAKPVRAAVVEVLNVASTVLASTTTDDSGAYSVTVPSSTLVFVRVKAQTARGGSGANWDVSVRDNTQSGALYAMDSPTFSSGSAPSLTRNLRATSGWGGSGYSGQRVAAPFAVLDTVYTAMQKILSVAPGTAFPVLRVFWSVNNLPASGNIALGQIGTTMFTSSSQSGNVVSRAIYVLGKENVDTDEYDASVIAHEWGHYYQSAFSRDDSPGGPHSLGELIDRRLAFSEGWGNAWSGIALARRNYTDSAGPNQAQGSNIDLSTGVSPGSNPGWFREASIQSIFWNLNNQVGFAPIHDAMTGPFKTGVAVTSIHPFSVAFNAAAPGSASTLNSLLTGQGIAVPNDPYADNESNGGGSGISGFTLPMYKTATVGVGATACVTNQADPFRDGNKLGSYAYLRFSAPAGNHTINVTGPSGSNPDFEVYQGRRVGAGLSAVPASESGTVSLSAGEAVLVVNDYNNASANTCFNVTIN